LKWFGGLLVEADVAQDLALQISNGGEDSSIDEVALELAEPTLDLIEPGWKVRFEEQGIEGLQGRHQGGKPRRATPAVQGRVIRRAQQKPSDGSTHWSCRKLAEELGVSKSTVQRILAQTKLRPHRLESYMASNDPEFESKAADIIGLYLNPPQHAAVFCVDEKTAIQALDRLDPVLPLSPGRAERHGFEYYRHGTAVAVRGVECEDRNGRGKNSAAAHQCGVHRIPDRTGK